MSEPLSEPREAPEPVSQPEAKASASTSVHDRRRRRLDRELGFSAPGPAFQMQVSGASPASASDDTTQPETSSSPSQHTRHSRRIARPSQAALESGMLRMWQAKPDGALDVVTNTKQLLQQCIALQERLVHATDEARSHEHATLVRELYHMMKFVNKVPYDPSIAQKPTHDVWTAFVAQCELASHLWVVDEPVETPRRRPSDTARARSSPRPRMSPALTPPAKRARVMSRGIKRSSPPSPPRTQALVPVSSAAVDPSDGPPHTYQAPHQCPRPPSVPGGDLRAMLASMHMWGDEFVTEAVREQRLARETALYCRLDAMRRAGHTLEPDGTTSLIKMKPQEAPRAKAHWDHVLDGVVHRSQRMRQHHRSRMQLAKKVSRMITAHWDRELHSDEREQKLAWRRQRALAKWTMKEVQRQWKLAVTVIRGRKQEAERAEREKLGKKQLQAIIEQSTQMLETQHAELALEEATEDEDDEDEEQDDEVDEDQDEESSMKTASEASVSSEDDTEDDALEQAMWEEDEEDEDEDDDLRADADLPLEELMKKYGYGAHERSSAAASPSRSASDRADDDRMEDDEASHDDAQDEESDDDAHDKEEESDDDGQDEEEAEASVSLQALIDTKDEADTALPKVRPPFLLRGTLRPYQQMGMEWLISLYSNQMNGILADEMGLGKTIQTISLLAHLACDRGVWGPHLIVAPTSVMLNWEMEFKKFLPGFKILSYYGTQKQRKAKRVGWNTPNSFNVCITSYQLVLADQHIFRRKPWVYLVLDEAHHIKNFRSQRWQTLLGFNSERRLLLTGTPLQNNLMDLWSLMYFLMPQGLEKVAAATGAFTNMKDFQEWFSNPLGKAAESTQAMDEETQATVAKLHMVLRPYVLRRLKSDVEREMPKKYEHVVPCRLSKRQRFLYNDFMSRAKTRESLASGNYMSIINCLMQLRKVCNHPDLFEPRPIVTPFVTRAVAADYEIEALLVRRRLLQQDPWAHVNLDFLHLRFAEREPLLTPLATRRYATLDASEQLLHHVPPPGPPPSMDTRSLSAFHKALEHHRALARYEQAHHAAYVNHMRCQAQPVYGRNLLRMLQTATAPLVVPTENGASHSLCFSQCDALRHASLSHCERADQMRPVLTRFSFATPPAIAPALPPVLWEHAEVSPSLRARPDPLHQAAVSLNIAFPDASLLQYDCGKLQKLDELMRRLVDGGHRVLIFTQMTKVLDILEKFFNYHGYRYLRLDGATKVEQRQALTERFNRDSRISAFILSTRSGGLGINLVGADTVIFYDLDWNAAIEAQCMDRAHRIGQTRDVHIYRFVSEHTIEENMLRKANQKRRLDSMVIQQGEFTTEHLMRNDWRDMLDEGGKTLGGIKVGEDLAGDEKDVEKAFRAAEDVEDAAAVHVADEEMQMDHADFEGDVQAASSSHDADKEETRARSTSAVPTNTDDPDDAVLDEEEGDEDDDLTGTIDDYMLRYVLIAAHR